MNIIDFFRDVVEDFNSTQKCGECWSFKAPLSESGMNSTKLSDDELCCVKLFLTSYKYESGFQKNNLTGLQKKGWCDYVFTIYAVKETNLGINVDQEQPGFEIDESLYETILRPIENCLGCSNEFDLCELGYDFDIFKWSMTPTLLKGDMNYVGWKIDAIFREYK